MFYLYHVTLIFSEKMKPHIDEAETNSECNSGDDYYKKGVLFYNCAKFRKAIENFNKCIEFNYEIPKAYVKKGQSFLRLEKYCESLDCFNKSIELMPDSNEAYLYKAICLERNGNKEEAQLMYEKANEIIPDPNDAESKTLAQEMLNHLIMTMTIYFIS